MRPGNSYRRFELLAVEVLADLLGLSPKALKVRAEDKDADLRIATRDHTFLIEVKASSQVASIASGILSLQRFTGLPRRKVVPVLAVPFMGDTGKRLCEQAGVGWFDLSGNAQIAAPGLRILVEGRPNRFPKVGRPPNLFAPRSSRVARWLLMHPAEHIKQTALAHEIGLAVSDVGRIVARLEEAEYIVRVDGTRGDWRHGNPGKPALTARDPSLLLDAWLEAYDFSKHRIIEGHVPARSGEELAEQVSKILRKEGLQHAATGLAAAWAYTKFAQFRIASFYLSQEPTDGMLEQLGFRSDPKGANLWLVVPNDLGVFQGASDREGLTCVHPVQAFLDLKGHPERAKEAAERLRADYLSWEKAMMGKLQ